MNINFDVLVKEYGVEEVYSSTIESKSFDVFLSLYGSKHKFTVKNGFSLVHLAVIHKNIEVLKFLSSAGYDMNASDVDGLTSLHLAVISKSNECFDYLLKHEAVDIGLKSKEGNTFLHFAAMVNNMYVAMHRDRQLMHRVFNMKNKDGKYCGEMVPSKEFSNGIYSADVELYTYGNKVAPEFIKIKYKEEEEN